MDSPKTTLTGRVPSQPAMQNLRPTMSPEQQKLADQLRDILRRHANG